ncbi:MAG: hypothetical protein ABIQ98_00220 [Sphingomicrobium sp.]
MNISPTILRRAKRIAWRQCDGPTWTRWTLRPPRLGLFRAALTAFSENLVVRHNFLPLGFFGLDSADVVNAGSDVVVAQQHRLFARTGEIGRIARAQQELGQPLVIITTLAEKSVVLRSGGGANRPRRA